MVREFRIHSAWGRVAWGEGLGAGVGGGAVVYNNKEIF